MFAMNRGFTTQELKLCVTEYINSLENIFILAAFLPSPDSLLDKFSSGKIRFPCMNKEVVMISYASRKPQNE